MRCKPGEQACLRSERGTTLIIFMVVLAVLATIAMGAIRISNLNYRTSSAYKKQKQVFYSSEMGLNAAINDIITQYNALTPYTQSADYAGADASGYMTVANYHGYQVKYKVTNPLAAFLYQTISGVETINNFAHTYDIIATSTSLTDKSSKTMNERVYILETPLVQYYVFYGGSGNAADLEIYPGSLMNSWGRIHSNGNIYVGGDSGPFNLRNYDTNNNLAPHEMAAAGGIFINRKNNGAAPAGGGAVIKTTNTTTLFAPTLQMAANITTAAQAAPFNNFVLVKQPVLVAPSQTMFLRGGFYETRAGNPQTAGIDGIQIIGTGGLAGGTKVYVALPAYTDVTALVNTGKVASGAAAAGVTLPIISETTNAFCDDRQNKNVDTTNIDLHELGLWYKDYLTDKGLALGTGGMLVYTSRSPVAPSPWPNTGANLQAIRLMKLNAGAAGTIASNTTLATDNPMYIQGDFNTVTTKGVALVSDAINLLSNAFAGRTCAAMPGAAATSTTYYAAMFSGNVPTPAGGGTYSGGLENYPRYHENWTGTVTITGSFINLWSSAQSTGAWPGTGGTHYNPPTRAYGWDVRFANSTFWPPFIPSIYSVQLVSYLG